jgi:hypothetical protein
MGHTKKNKDIKIVYHFNQQLKYKSDIKKTSKKHNFIRGKKVFKLKLNITRPAWAGFKTAEEGRANNPLLSG